LIEVESVDADVLQEIIEETSPGPLVVPGTSNVSTTLRPPVTDGSDAAERAV
jgi:hypothetical protein